MNVSKTIAELYNGNLCPIRNLGRFNDEIKHLETLIEKTREDLESKLNDEQRTFLKKFEGNINEYMCQKRLFVTDFAWVQKLSLSH